MGGRPALVEQPLHLVVGDPERLVRRRLDEGHLRAVAAHRPHPHGCQRAEALGDLAGVAQVVVEHERHQRDRRAAEPREEPLVLVGVDVEPALLRVAQRREQGGPPVLGEVLGLVDDDRVELLTLRQPGGQLGHPRRQLLLPEVAVVPAGVDVGAPGPPELLETPDEGRRVPAPGTLEGALEPLAEPDRVAQQRHPLRALLPETPRQLLRLGHGQHGLAAARPAAHLDPVQQPGDAQDHRLLLGEPVGPRLAVVGLGDDVGAHEIAPGEDLGDELHVVVAGPPVVGLVRLRQRPQPLRQVRQVVAAVHHRAGAPGLGEVLRDGAVWRHHRMQPPHPGA
ncbi:hypothetical protein [Ornithinimicrobium kibberense]|uniref:hypothetical protein n=1 Tax=Ornithinimicrobium kibberense TaxID=282060 RepID=UPI003615FBF0